MKLTTTDVMCRKSDFYYIDCSLYRDGAYCGILTLSLRRSFFFSGTTREATFWISSVQDGKRELTNMPAELYDYLYGLAMQRDIETIIEYFVENHDVQLG